MNSRTVRERMKAAWESVDKGDRRPMERYVMDLWHECRSAREKLEAQERACKALTAAGQREHAELQETRIEIEALKQKLAKAQAEIAKLTKDITVDGSRIEIPPLWEMDERDWICLRATLVEQAIICGRLDLVEWLQGPYRTPDACSPHTLFRPWHSG